MSSYKVINLTSNSVSVPLPVGRMLGPHKSLEISGLPTALDDTGILDGVRAGLFSILPLDTEDAVTESIIPVNPASTLTVYVSSTGSNTNLGTFAAPWFTLQHAFDQVPENFDGNLIIQMDAGKVDAGLLNTRIKKGSRVVVIGNRSTAPDVDLLGATFAFADHATATGNVGAYAATVTNDSHWIEHAVIPAPDVYALPDFACMNVVASTSPNLSMTTVDDSQAFRALRAYETIIEEDGGFTVGCTVPRQVVDFVGIDFGTADMTAVRCRFSGCRKDGLDATNSILENCVGGLQLSKVSGRFTILVSHTETIGMLVGMISEVTINIVGSGGSTSGTGATALVFDNVAHFADNIWVRNKSNFNMSFSELREGSGVSAIDGATVSLQGFLNFTGTKIANVSTGSNLNATGGSYTANVSGEGITITSGGKASGIETAFSAATVAGNDVVVDGVGVTFAALPVNGSVGTGSACN